MVAAPVHPEKIEAVLAQRMYQHGPILGMFSRLHRDHLELWVVTEPLTHDQELALYSVVAQVSDEIPDLAVDVHIEHAAMYQGVDPFAMVPQDAHRFHLHTR